MLKFRRYNIHLVVIGDGPERTKVQKFIRKHHLEKIVSLLGQKLSQKEKIKRFQHADIFCAPYVDEAMPITILEAMSCGCPIVGF